MTKDEQEGDPTFGPCWRGQEVVRRIEYGRGAN
jgi:hypothetical protein